MLEGLDSIAWSSIKDANGDPATDVPDRIRALYSADEKERRGAMDALHGRLFSLGSVNAATTAAVPFLVALCAGEGTPDRHAILAFLRALLTVLGQNEREGFTPERGRADPVELEATARAVRDGGGIYVRCTRAADARTRSAAAALLALASPIPEAADAVRAAVAREKVAAAHASEILALGLIGRRLGSREDLPSLDRLRASPDLLLRAAAAIATVYLDSTDVTDALLDTLVEGARIHDLDDADLPWRGGHLAHLAAIALAEVGRTERERALTKLRAMTELRAAAMPPAPPWTPSPAEEMLAKMTGIPLIPPPPRPPAGVLEIAAECLRTAVRPFVDNAQEEVALETLDAPARAALRFLAVELELELGCGSHGLPERGDARWRTIS